LAQATEQALELADMFKGVARRISTFRVLRRFSGRMNMNAGQVNISAGPQQVNGNVEER
jgi:hypothetical protein